jgi:hypothetical protein
MEDYQLYFPNVKDVEFLKFQSALTDELAASAEWVPRVSDLFLLPFGRPGLPSVNCVFSFPISVIIG